MSDHFASTGSISNYEVDDETYFALLSRSGEVKPKPTKTLETLPIVEIRNALESPQVYDAPRGSSKFIHQLHADLAMCPLCRYVNFDRFQLGAHIAEHEEVRQFREVTNRQARLFDQVSERKWQCIENIERLKVESRQLEKQIRAFDVKSLQDRQRQI